MSNGEINSWSYLKSDPLFDSIQYGYYKVFTKRDIKRKMTFKNYADYLEKVIQYSESTPYVDDVTLTADITYDDKVFNIQGIVKKNLIKTLFKREQEFLDNLNLSKYTTTITKKGELITIDLVNYIKDKKLNDFIDLL